MTITEAGLAMDLPHCKERLAQAVRNTIKARAVYEEAQASCVGRPDAGTWEVFMAAERVCIGAEAVEKRALQDLGDAMILAEALERYKARCRRGR